MVNVAHQVFWERGLFLDKSAVDDKPGVVVGELVVFPHVNFLDERLEVALHLLKGHSDYGVQVKVFGVLFHYRGIIPEKRKVVAYEDPEADSQPE